jgi:AcrR family transcriptional regulator
VVTQRGASRKPAGERAAKASIRREQLLDTALELFCEHGFAATSTRRIAEAAGVTEGLVFHYFKSKEALLLELASRQHTFAGRIRSLVQRASGGTARELFMAVAEGYAEVTEREASFVGFLTAEAQVNPLLRGPIVAGTKVVVDAFTEMLVERQKTGELRTEAVLGHTVVGFFGGFSFFFAQNREASFDLWRREASEFARAWADQCWRGVANPKLLSDPSTNARKRSR